VSKPFAVGAYANQRLNLVAKGKAHGRDVKTSNRTWEIRPSGIIGGLGKRGPGGIVNSPRNRKGESVNPPPNANASEFYPNQVPRRSGNLSVMAALNKLTALCDTCETGTFIPRIFHFIGAELALLPETG
jgi:hypothetical protein